MALDDHSQPKASAPQWQSEPQFNTIASYNTYPVTPNNNKHHKHNMDIITIEKYRNIRFIFY